MPEDNIYFDRLYKKKKNFSFPVDLESLTYIFTNLKKGKVLDIGTGESGNFIELAKKGFDVTVLDISDKIIEEIKKQANKENIKIRAIAQDISKFQFKENYDVILSIAVFHFLTRQDAINLIQNMKSHTNKRGINIIIAFRKSSLNQSQEDSFYVEDDELKEVYSDWKILEFENYNENEDKLSFIVAKNG